MKKTFFNALMLSLSLLALGSSCSDGEETEALPVLEVETQTMNFETKASSQEIQITTNIPDLKVQVQEDARDWCSAIIDGDKLVVSVLDNHNEGVRSTQSLSTGKLKAEKSQSANLVTGWRFWSIRNSLNWKPETKPKSSSKSRPMLKD